MFNAAAEKHNSGCAVVRTTTGSACGAGIEKEVLGTTHNSPLSFSALLLPPSRTAEVVQLEFVLPYQVTRWFYVERHRA